MWHHHPLMSEAYIFCKPETHLLRNLYTYICVSVCVCVYTCMCSVVSDSAISWTVACQVPLSMGFPRQGYWSGLPFLASGDLPDPGLKNHFTCISWIGRWILYHFATWEALYIYIYIYTHTHIHICVYIYTHTHQRACTEDFLAEPVYDRQARNNSCLPRVKCINKYIMKYYTSITINVQ